MRYSPGRPRTSGLLNRPHRVARRKQVLDENTFRAIRREMMQVLRGCAKALLSAQRGGSLGRHRRG
jgi:hypothetical protein